MANFIICNTIKVPIALLVTKNLRRTVLATETPTNVADTESGIVMCAQAGCESLRENSQVKISAADCPSPLLRSCDARCPSSEMPSTGEAWLAVFHLALQLRMVTETEGSSRLYPPGTCRCPANPSKPGSRQAHHPGTRWTGEFEKTPSVTLISNPCPPYIGGLRGAAG